MWWVSPVDMSRSRLELDFYCCISQTYILVMWRRYRTLEVIKTQYVLEDLPKTFINFPVARSNSLTFLSVYKGPTNSVFHDLWTLNGYTHNTIITVLHTTQLEECSCIMHQLRNHGSNGTVTKSNYVTEIFVTQQNQVAKDRSSEHCKMWRCRLHTQWGCESCKQWHWLRPCMLISWCSAKQEQIYNEE